VTRPQLTQATRPATVTVAAINELGETLPNGAKEVFEKISRFAGLNIHLAHAFHRCRLIHPRWIGKAAICLLLSPSLGGFAPADAGVFYSSQG
jgi:hypothetical protein